MPSAKKSTGKQCSIYKFLEKTEPDLAEAISDICMEGALHARGKYGISFIMPDSGLMKKIIEAAYSEEPEEAANMLSACIITSFANNASNFPMESGNKLGYKLVVDKVDGKKVKFNGGKLEIEIDNSFKPMADKQLAVWKLVSGTPIMSGEKFDYKSNKGSSKAKKQIKGSAEIASETTYAARQRLLNNIQLAYTEKLYNQSQGKTIGGADSATKIVSSLLNRLYMNAEQEQNVNCTYTKAFTALASTIDPDPIVTAALILNNDPQLASIIDPALGALHANGGLDTTMSINPNTELANYCDQAKMNTLLSNLKVQNNMSEASKLLKEKRESIVEKYSETGVLNSDPIINAYRDLYVNNRVNHGGASIDNVFPSTFIAGIAESQDLTPAGQQNIAYNALARDLMRHTLSLANMDLASEVVGGSANILQNEVRQNMLDAKLFYQGGNASANASLFTNVKKEMKSIGSKEPFDALRSSFMNSTDFLYLPVAISGGSSIHVYGGELYNRHAACEKELHGGKADSLVEEYKNLLRLHGDK